MAKDFDVADRAQSPSNTVSGGDRKIAFEKATPRPWRVAGLQVKGEGGVVAECPPPQKGGVFACAINPALIVHAVNHHDKLVEALAELVSVLNDIIANGSLEGTTAEAPAAVAVTSAEAVLTAARGEGR